MIRELVKAIAEKDFVTTKDIFESLVQGKLAAKIEEERLVVSKKMFGDDISEELKGNQHKLDANKNGKIDADDFKKLRNKKKVDEDEECDIKEDSEQLDELSKSTLGSYIKKSAQHRTRLAVAGSSLETKSDAISKAKHGIEDDETYNSLAKAATNLDKQRHKVQDKDYNRATGISRAVKRLTKEEAEEILASEEFEQLDEISSSLASSYIRSARPQSEFSPTGVPAPGKDRTSGVRLALKKKWGDKKFGFPEPKVKATD